MKASRILVALQAISICIMACLYGCSGGGSDSSAPLSSEKEITEYSINGVDGTINEIAKTILVIMPYGTDVTTLVATFNTTGSSVRIDTTQQISGKTANNFTTPMTYTITAADSSTQTYVVTVIEIWKIISTLKLSSSYTPTRLAFQNGIAFIADGAIQIINVNIPGVSTVISTIGNNYSGQIGIFDKMENVSVSDNKILVGAGIGCNGWCNVNPFAGHLYAYDITNPASPVKTSSLEMGTGDILLEGNIAYVTQMSMESKLDVIDISVQPQLSILGSVNIVGAGSLAKIDNFIFNQGNLEVLDTIDATNYTNPSVLYDGSDGAIWIDTRPIYKIAILGNALYIAGGTDGLRVWNISNPAAPSFVLTMPTLSSVNDVAVYDGYLYVADEASGIRVFDISNSMNPVYAGTISTAPYAAKLVALSGGVGVAVFKDTSDDYYFGVFMPGAN